MAYPPRSRDLLLTRHRCCDHCGGPLPDRFGQRFCDADCRALGKAAEQRAARELWRQAGRPMLDEQQAHTDEAPIEIRKLSA